MTKVWAERLPKSIRVGPYDYRVELWPVVTARASQRYGECSPMEACLRVQDEHPTLPQLVDVVFHEVSHALYRVYQIEDEDKEERIVSAQGLGWTQIFRDNPKLVQWLYDASAEMRGESHAREWE